MVSAICVHVLCSQICSLLLARSYSIQVACQSINKNIIHNILSEENVEDLYLQTVRQVRVNLSKGIKGRRMLNE